MTPEEQRSEEILSIIAIRSAIDIPTILFVSSDYCILAICSTQEDLTKPETIQHFDILKTLTEEDRLFRHHCLVNFIKDSHSASSLGVPIVTQVL